MVVNDEFLEHCSEGALSIEVWGHHSMGFGSSLSWEMEQVQAKSHSIMDRWDELTRKMELCVEIHELSEQGEYAPVEVMQRTEVLTGGVYQLRQVCGWLSGHSSYVLSRAGSFATCPRASEAGAELGDPSSNLREHLSHFHWLCLRSVETAEGAGLLPGGGFGPIATEVEQRAG